MSKSKRNGLLIDYEFCTGCHSCEVACKKELGLPHGKFGIKLTQYGPEEIAPDKWDYFYVPLPTDLCDLCADRIQAGKQPTCVHHCQAKVMQFGPIDELAKQMNEKRKTVLFAP